MIFLARTPTGDYAFYDDTLGPVPTPSVQLSDTLWRDLLAANGKGASLTIKDGGAAALDYQGNVIDLSKMTAASSYARPPALADLAQPAFQKVRQQFQDLQMMGQTFGPKMQAYARALNAIVTGTDATSTAMPTAPTDPTQ